MTYRRFSTPKNSFLANSRLCRTLAVGIAALLLSQLTYAGELVGRIADTTGRAAIGGAQVEIVNPQRRAVSDSAGMFRIGNLPAGTYEVNVRYVDAAIYNTTVTVPAEGATRIDVNLAPLPGFEEELIVIGQRAAQAGALSKQRYADTVSSFLTRDAIGQFPDQNVTEAVRRLPGVNVENDQGEGRFIVLRGLSPSLNASSLNGVRIVAPESDIRAVALDVVPAELVETIEVQKSLIPEMDGDAIGGAIDIRTPSAFEREGSFLSLTTVGSYNDQMDEWSPKFGVDASTTINDRLGISIGYSYFDRKLGSDNIEADDWSDEDGIVYAESVELRDYDVTRTRIGGTLGLDYLLTDSTTLYARGVYSSFEDKERRSRLEFDFGDAVPVSGDASTANFLLSDDEELEVARDIKDRTEKQKIASLLLGGETFLDAWSFRYEGSYSYSEEDEPNSYDPTVFVRGFEAGELGVSQQNTGSDNPNIVVGDAFFDDYTDATTYEFDELEVVDGKAEDEEYAFRIDVARDFMINDAQAQLKFGTKGRFREKKYDLDTDIYDGYDGAEDFLLSDVERTIDYDLGDINPVPSASLTSQFIGDFTGFELNDAESLFESAAASYEVDEDIMAAYVQGRYEAGPWMVIGGIRYENTDDDVSGNTVALIEEGGTIDGEPVTEDTTLVTPVNFKNSYDDWLPSLNVKYTAREDLVFRLAGYRSLSRPNIADLAPRFLIEQNDEDDREGELGNPDLDPYVAWNYDASAEWYFADNAVLQAGLFYKDIEDFIVIQALEDVEFGGVVINEATIPVNGDDATVFGVELNYQQALTNLPGLLSGLLVGVNYTYVDTEADLGDRKVDLPGSSESVVNVALGYEQGPISIRVAWVYRDKYLDEVSSDGETDRFVDDHSQLDIVAKYMVTPQFQVFVEAINITDEPFYAYQDIPDLGERAMQYEEYSYTLNLGLRATF